MRKNRPALFRGRHFQENIIVLCVRWYLRYPLSYRNLEEMMAERGLTVDHSTIARAYRATLRGCLRSGAFGVARSLPPSSLNVYLSALRAATSWLTLPSSRFSSGKGAGSWSTSKGRKDASAALPGPVGPDACLFFDEGSNFPKLRHGDKKYCRGGLCRAEAYNRLVSIVA